MFAGFAYNQVCLENARNLREEAAYIAQAVELSGVAYLEKLSPEDGSPGDLDCCRRSGAL